MAPDHESGPHDLSLITAKREARQQSLTSRADYWVLQSKDCFAALAGSDRRITGPDCPTMNSRLLCFASKLLGGECGPKDR